MDPIEAARRKLDAIEAHLVIVRDDLTAVLAETPEQSAVRLLKLLDAIRMDLAAAQAKDALIAQAAGMIERYATGKVAVVANTAAVVVGPMKGPPSPSHNGHA